MNKYQEALEIINTKVFFLKIAKHYGTNASIPIENNNSDELENACLILQELVDRATPKKAVITGITYYNYNIKTKKHEIIYQGKCGVCGNGMISDSRYCNKCGTEIDWSEDNA